MYKELIKSYIPKLTPKLIKEYGKKLNINKRIWKKIKYLSNRLRNNYIIPIYYEKL